MTGVDKAEGMGLSSPQCWCVLWKKTAAGDHIFVPAVDEHGIRNTGTGSLKIFVHHGPPLL